jgi:hypothetical protein
VTDQVNETVSDVATTTAVVRDSGHFAVNLLHGNVGRVARPSSSPAPGTARLLHGLRRFGTYAAGNG